MDNGQGQHSIPPSAEQIQSWQDSYDNLFKDKIGRRYFEVYLDGRDTADGSHKMSLRLQFTGAVLGFRAMFENGDISAAKNIAKTIFKRYFVKPPVVVPLLKPQTYNRLSAFIADLDSPNKLSEDADFVTRLKNVFNDAQKEVHESLANSAYRSFLQSDYFVEIINLAENANRRNNNFTPSINGHSDSHSSNFTHSPRSNAPNGGYRHPPAISSSSSSSHPRSSFANDEVCRSHQNFLASNASFAAADAKEANNNRSQNTGAIPKSSKMNNRTRLCHLTKPMSALPEDTEVKINPSNLSQVPSILANNSLHKLLPSVCEAPDYNRHQESYFKCRDLPQPPNPYHVDYGPVLPTSAQDSELASYSSGATRSDVSSHIDIRPDSKITEEELKHQRRMIRRDLPSNRGATRPGIELNKSVLITAAKEERQKVPNPEKDVDAFYELIRSKLEAHAAKLEMQKSANQLNFQSLRVLSGQDEGQAILDSHVKKCLDWGEPTPPAIDRSGCLSPPPRLASKTLPRNHHPHSQLNHQMTADEKVNQWANQDKDASSKSKKSSHSVHSGSFKSSKSKNYSGRSPAVGSSLCHLNSEHPSALPITLKNNYSTRPTSALNHGKSEASVYIYYTLEDPKNGKKSDENERVYKVSMPTRPVKLIEFKNKFHAFAQANSYKYYFKKFDQVFRSHVFEDITDDDAELPILQEGYIMANVVKCC